MTPIRRLLLIVCIATTATAQTPQTNQATPKTKSNPAQATVSTPAATSQAQKELENSQPVTNEYTAPVTADTDKDLTNPRALRLSLNDAISTSVAQNLGIQIQKYTYREAGQSLLEAWGPFDWFTTADVEHQSNRTPTISQFQSSAQRTTFVDLGLQQLLPTGGTYSASFNNSRTTTAGGGTLISPAFSSAFNIGLTQPLARNFGIDITRRDISVARNTLGINNEAFRLALMNTAANVEQAYLNLIYARRFVDVQKEALFLARDQARITQIRINVGASAPLDILQPQVQIATTEEALIAAVAAVRDAEDQLRQLLNLPPGDWDRPILPTDTVTYTPMTIDVESAVARAEDLRPELREQKLTTANARVQYVYAKNQVLPRFDAIVNYRAAGLGGNATIIDPNTGNVIGTTSSALPHAIGQVLGSDFPSWTVGFQVGVPILNIGARAEAKRTELEVDRNRALENQQRQTIALDVRKSTRDIDTAAKEIVATRTAREAAEKNVDAERKRYENGMTTIFQVLQIQQQLSSARASELQALVGYNQAIANFHRSVGDLLDVLDIRLEPETVQEPNILHFFDRFPFLYSGLDPVTPAEKQQQAQTQQQGQSK